MTRHAEPALVAAQRWLLLTHQLPAKPAYFRVKVWRRLQSLGAVAVKNAVYALPFSEQAQEDFEWLLKEIIEGGGESLICEARLVGGLSDEEVRNLFRAARDADYDELASDSRALDARIDGDLTPEKQSEATGPLKRLKARRDAIVAVDFFGANGRETVDGLLAAIEDKLQDRSEGQGSVSEQETQNHMLAGLTGGRTWVTREGVHVDRIASAWLIRRFIDPEAVFKFVPARGYEPLADELRFDMFEAEFTHEGDRCTFEVLLLRAGLSDPALTAIGEIVHDIDLKDGKFGREEAAGIRTLIAGLCSSSGDDTERLARGAAIFDDLHGYFRKAARD
jgi:hypothetical protein